MIFSYFDDSSDDKREKHVAVGGIIGHEIWLNLFEGKWIEDTKHLTEPFRSTDCETKHGQFTNWDKPACDALMKRLVGVVADKETGIGSVAFDVVVPLYREVFPGCDEKGPMRLAVAKTIVEMARLARKHNEKIQLWFEEGSFDSLILQTYNDLRAIESWRWDERGRLFRISFASKELVPLQAADLVAREGYKIADNWMKRPLRKPVLGIWDRMQMSWYTKPTLELLKAKGWPNLEAIVSLPEDRYIHEQRNDGTQYFKTGPPEQANPTVDKFLTNLRREKHNETRF